MKKFFQVVGYLLFLFIVLEIGLRIFSHYHYHTNFFKIRRYLADEHVLWKLNPGYRGILYSYREARINSDGFLGDEIANPKPDNLVRVCVLGGSVAFGVGVSKIEDNFTSQLQELLNAASMDKKFEVVNTAVVGYSSYMGREFVENYLGELKPDVLVVGFGWNDNIQDYMPDNKPETWKNRIVDIRPNFFEETFMIAAIVPRITTTILRRTHVLPDTLQTDGRKRVHRVSLDSFHENMTAIVQYCKEHNVKVLLWTEPVAYGSKTGSDLIKDLQVYQKTMRQLADEQNVPLADIDAHFKVIDVKPYFFDPEVDYIHPNREGQHLMAEIVCNTFLKTGWFGLHPAETDTTGQGE